MSKRKKRSNLTKYPGTTPGAKVTAMPAVTGPVPRTPANAGFKNNQQSMQDTNAYKEMARSYVRDAIEELDANNFFSPFQPVRPYGPPAVTYPRTFDYRVGLNLDIHPARLSLLEQLRLMRRGWGLLSTVIETRKDQFMRIPWDFQVKGSPRKKSKYIDQLHEFFRRPDGKNTFSKWRRLYLDDLLVTDAPAIYIWKSVTGQPIGLDVLDGTTIKPLIDDAGRRPTAPDPAFQQIVKGLPMVNLSENELLYTPMRPTPELPIYGYSPVEQIYFEITAALKRLLYQIEFWTQGSMPELIVTVPDTWGPAQVVQFQANFDAMMAGNTKLKSRVKFMPGGMKPFDIKNANGEGLKADIDEWWARLVCFAFSIPPTPFTRQVNRATAQTAQETAEEEGLHPLMTHFKEEVMDILIQDPDVGFGFDEIEYNFLPNPEVDQQKQMQIITGYVKEGIYSRNEGRDQLGLGAVPGGDVIAVDTTQGPLPITMIGKTIQPAQPSVQTKTPAPSRRQSGATRGGAA
jgi:hypothetical protein